MYVNRNYRGSAVFKPDYRREIHACYLQIQLRSNSDERTVLEASRFGSYFTDDHPTSVNTSCFQLPSRPRYDHAVLFLKVSLVLHSCVMDDNFIQLRCNLIALW